LPGATATISVTLPSAVAAADLLVALEPATTPDLAPANGGIMPQAPQPLAVAGHPPTAAGARLPAISYQSGPAGFLVSGDVGAGGPGLATLQIPLPDEPGNWRVMVYALDGAARVARAATTVRVSEPLISTLITPPNLRRGDEADLVLELTNTVAFTRSLQVDLDLQGAGLTTPAAAEQQLLLAPGSTQTLTWRFTPEPNADAISVQVRLNDGANTTLTRRMPVLPATARAPFTGATLRNTGSLELTLPESAVRAEELELALAPSLSATLAESVQHIAALPEPSTVDRAAQALIAARLAAIVNNPDSLDWREQARFAVEALLTNQNNDGGWGWWPGMPSDPFVSAFVVEALAVNQPTFGSAARPDPRAFTYLERSAANAEPNLRAYLAFAAARAGQPLPDTTALLDSDLGPAGLAYLALALPADQAEPVLTRLSTLPGPPWSAAPASRLPNSPTAINAAVVEAFRNRSPGAPQIAAAENALAESWGIDGWGGSFSAARVAAALPLSIPSNGPRRITLNDQMLAGATTPFTTTVRARVTTTDFGTPLTLTVESSGTAPYLLAYRTMVEPAPVRAPAAILTVSYHDPAGGALVAPTQLRAGQLVEIRLQIIATQRIAGAQIILDLPATLLPLEATPSGPVIRAQINAPAAQVQFFAPQLNMGVSRQTVLARVTARGSFTVPPPYLVTLDGAAHGPVVTLAPNLIFSR
jgi:uncharacterized protein YfaS (alpha-2-macroglobulin family)